jgi:phosphatidylglycerophosphate synthase
VIDEAVLYLGSLDDAPAAGLTVAGRPVAFRTLVAALRAGARRLRVPSALRPALEPAITASPSARAAVLWLEPGAAPPEKPVLLLPAAAVVTAPALAAVLAGPVPGVLVGSRPEAPVAAADPQLVGELWVELAAGAPIGAALERGLERRGPASVAGGWHARVAGAADARAVERRLYAALDRSPLDTALDRMVHRPLAAPVTRGAVALGVSANVVTVASVLVGLAAVVSFGQATPGAALAGLLLYGLSVVLDHADGAVARLTLTESVAGERLDVVGDTVVHALLVLVLGLTAEAVAGGMGTALGAVAAAGVVASAILTKAGAPTAATGLGRLLRGLGTRDPYYLMLAVFTAGLAVAPHALTPFMGVVALGAHAYWVVRLLHRGPGRKTARTPK